MTRLIDADALKSTIMSKADNMEDLWDTAGVLNAINNAPTVEIDKLILIVAKRSGKRELMLNALRPRGEWIQDIQGDTICKNCGFECLYNEEGMYSLGRYCHHCGARMEADNESK